MSDATGTKHEGRTSVGAALQPGLVIMGCPRSGTSWLAALLESRHGLKAPVESHFVRYFDGIARRLTPGDARALRHIARAIYCFLDHWVPINNRVRSRELALSYSLAATQAHLPEMLDGCHGYRDLVGRLFSTFSAIHQGTGWIEQSVYADPVSLAYLDHYPADTPVIHLVRDGRDVWLSWRRTWFSPDTLSQAARWWDGHVRNGRAWGRSNPSRYLEIRYEDLVQRPDSILETIDELLGRTGPAASQPWEGGLARVLSSGGTHDRIGQAPSGDSLNRWQREMTAAERIAFEHIAGSGLDLMGYERPLIPLAQGAAGVKVSIADRVRAGLGRNRVKRQIKGWLPVACWIKTLRG